MKLTLISLLALLLILMGLAYWQGADTFKSGWQTASHQIIGFLPIIIIALLIAGFIEALLPQHLIQTWLSDASGWRGITIAWLAGILTPGGSIIGLPLIASLYKAGVGISIIITYATSFATLSILRLPMEVGFYGWRLTLLRVTVSLILPFIAGGLTLLLLPLYQR